MSVPRNFYDRSDTIAAIATPPGEGGVAIVRLSGSGAVEIADRLFSGKVTDFNSHTAHLGHVLNSSGEMVDEVLILPMLGRRSFTGEDTVELHCHGGALVSRRVLEIACEHGARLAGPGEFSFRAFMNGRLDLAQAEAVQQLIHARNEWAVGAAADQLQGRLSKCIRKFQEQLTNLAAIFEAWVDFPEEGLEFASEEEIAEGLLATLREMEALLSTFHDGRIVEEGLSLCIAGKPNVGKSSLLNALLQRDRAIVTEIPGTTRDLLEESLQLNGLNLRVMDTAGIRETEEIVEREGIRRSRQAMESADLVVLVLDASHPLEEIDRLLLNQLPGRKAVVVWNKCDLGESGVESVAHPSCLISVRQEQGIEELRSTIDSVIWEQGPPNREHLLVTNVRHREALEEAIRGLRAVLDGLRNGVSPEFLCLDLRLSLHALGRILGTDVTEEILSAIFQRFCIGK